MSESEVGMTLKYLECHVRELELFLLMWCQGQEGTFGNQRLQVEGTGCCGRRQEAGSKVLRRLWQWEGGAAMV